MSTLREGWDWFIAIRANDPLALFLYWLPMLLCAVAYTARTYRNYRKDIADRAEAEAKATVGGKGFYIPTDTLGDLIGRGVVTILPFGNVLAATFDAAPELFGKFFDWLGRVFNQPLVPKRKG